MSLQKLLSKLSSSIDEALDEVIESKIQQHFDKGLLEMRLEKDALSDAKISAVKSLISSQEENNWSVPTAFTPPLVVAEFIVGIY